MTYIEKKSVVDRNFKGKTKCPRCYLIITDNHRKAAKKNTEHNYLIKKHKLNLNKKINLHCLHVLNKIVTRQQGTIRLLPGNNTSKSRSWFNV